MLSMAKMGWRPMGLILAAARNLATAYHLLDFFAEFKLVIVTKRAHVID